MGMRVAPLFIALVKECSFLDQHLKHILAARVACVVHKSLVWTIDTLAEPTKCANAIGVAGDTAKHGSLRIQCKGDCPIHDTVHLGCRLLHIQALNASGVAQLRRVC